MKQELNIAIRSAINAGFEILKIYNSNNFNVKFKNFGVIKAVEEFPFVFWSRFNWKALYRN